MPFITQNKTNWKFLLIVIVLAVIVGGGIWGWTKTQEIEKLEKVVEDETADQETFKDKQWETYENREWGFALDYPPSWDLQVEEVLWEDVLLVGVLIESSDGSKAGFSLVIGVPMPVIVGGGIESPHDLVGMLTEINSALADRFEDGAVEISTGSILGNSATRWDITGVYTMSHDISLVTPDIDPEAGLGRQTSFVFQIDGYTSILSFASQDEAAEEREIIDRIFESLRRL